MKTGFTWLFLLFATPIFAQLTVREQFEKIKTPQEAQKFIDANQALKPTLFHLTLGKDTTLIDKRLLRQNKGDVFSVGYVTYLVLDGTEEVNYRSNYIFLDGSSLSPSGVDSLKKPLKAYHSISFPICTPWMVTPRMATPAGSSAKK